MPAIWHVNRYFRAISTSVYLQEKMYLILQGRDLYHKWRASLDPDIVLGIRRLLVASHLTFKATIHHRSVQPRGSLPLTATFDIELTNARKLITIKSTMKLNIKDKESFQWVVNSLKNVLWGRDGDTIDGYDILSIATCLEELGLYRVRQKLADSLGVTSITGLEGLVDGMECFEPCFKIPEAPYYRFRQPWWVFATGRVERDENDMGEVIWSWHESFDTLN